MSEQRVRKIHLAVIIAVTVLSAAGYAAYAAVRASDLPDEIAVHFGAGGIGDDFQSAGTGLVVLGALVVGVSGLLIGLLWAVRWWQSPQARWATGLACGLAAFLAMVGVSVVSVNAEVTDAADAQVSVLWILAAVAVGVVIGVLAGAWLPIAPQQDRSRSVDAIALAGNERAVWFGDVTMHPALKYGAFALLAVSVVLVLFVPAGPGMWIALAAVALGTIAILSSTSFRVRVDANGLRWHSSLGFPRGTTPLNEIEGADVVDVRPLDYGGIGLRITGHTIALVPRTGPGLRVRRTGRDFVATVDDPETAAGLIEALRARHPVS